MLKYIAPIATCLTLSGLAVGCGYQPLGLAESKPKLADAMIERDIILYGENRFEIGEYTDNGFVCFFIALSALAGRIIE